MNEGLIKEKIREWWDSNYAECLDIEETSIDPITGKKCKSPFELIDELAKELWEVTKDETRLDEVPLLVKKWFGEEK
jgi:hypothetical protein